MNVSSASGDLVIRARGGDHAAFTELVRDCDERMRALAYRLLGNQTAMDDALQDAYLKAYSKLDTFAANAAFSTWLYTIVYRACLDHLRTKSRQAETPIDTVPEPTNMTDHSDRQADTDALQQALSTLPADQAAVVVLVDGDGCTYKQAATILDVSEGTIASRLNRSHKALKAALQPGDVEGSGT